MIDVDFGSTSTFWARTRWIECRGESLQDATLGRLNRIPSFSPWPLISVLIPVDFDFANIINYKHQS